MKELRAWARSPEAYLMRAEEMRTKADCAILIDSRRRYCDLALAYEKLAEQAAQMERMMSRDFQ